MTNAIKDIYKWQVDAGNASRPYEDFLEASFQIEEALEGFTDLPVLAKTLSRSDIVTVASDSPKDLSRAIVSLASTECDDISDVDRFDKACDAIVFAIGSMAKLGLTPQQINEGLLAVNKANVQKLGMPRDEKGKLMKPADFVGPEPALQAILDKRTK